MSQPEVEMPASSNLADKDSCRAAVFLGQGQRMEIRRFPLPRPRKGEVLVKIEGCTLCGSDLHTISGIRKEKTPSILGHEIVGTIAELGAEINIDNREQPVQIGDRITWSVCLSCGHCDRCGSGKPQKCRTIRKVGHETVNDEGPLIGGLSEYVLLPGSASFFKVPDGIDLNAVCPVNCATATVMAAMNAASGIQGKNVLIIGAGLLGLTACAVAKTNLAKRITVLDLNEPRLQLAKLFGAQHVAKSPHELEPFEPDSRQDVIFEFAGSPSTIEQTLKCLAVGAELILAGTVMPSPNVHFDPEFVVRNLVTIKGVHNYRPDDLWQAIAFLQEHHHQFPFSGLVEKTFSLEKINEAVDYAIQHKPIRVMVQP